MISAWGWILFSWRDDSVIFLHPIYRFPPLALFTHFKQDCMIKFSFHGTWSFKIFPYFLPVSDFAKKTGDFPSLSAVDIRVMALAYQLEKEFCSSEHIRDEPVHKVSMIKSEVTGNCWTKH